jgi:hypothetical protein
MHVVAEAVVDGDSAMHRRFSVQNAQRQTDSTTLQPTCWPTYGCDGMDASLTIDAFTTMLAAARYACTCFATLAALAPGFNPLSRFMGTRTGKRGNFPMLFSRTLPCVLFPRNHGNFPMPHGKNMGNHGKRILLPIKLAHRE